MSAPLHRQVADSAGFTVETAENLLPDNVRYELHGGVIHVMSPAARWHSRVQRRIANLLEGHGRSADTEIGLSIGPGDTRVLDVAAFGVDAGYDRAYYQPTEIELAVEVVSPSSRDNDYVDKPKLYAELGITEFWRADPDAKGVVHVSMYRLDTDTRTYVLTGAAALDDLEDQGIDHR